MGPLPGRPLEARVESSARLAAQQEHSSRTLRRGQNSQELSDSVLSAALLNAAAESAAISQARRSATRRSAHLAPSRSGPARGRSRAPSALSTSHSETVFYGAFAWARRALDRRKRRFPARAAIFSARKGGPLPREPPLAAPLALAAPRQPARALPAPRRAEPGARHERATIHHAVYGVLSLTGTVYPTHARRRRPIHAAAAYTV